MASVPGGAISWIISGTITPATDVRVGADEAVRVYHIFSDREWSDQRQSQSSVNNICLLKSLLDIPYWKIKLSYYMAPETETVWQSGIGK